MTEDISNSGINCMYWNTIMDLKLLHKTEQQNPTQIKKIKTCKSVQVVCPGNESRTDIIR